MEDAVAGKTTVASVVKVLMSLPPVHRQTLYMCLQLALQDEKLVREAQAKALGKRSAAKPGDDAPLPPVIRQKLYEAAVGSVAGTNSQSLAVRLDELNRAGVLRVAGESVAISVPRVQLTAALRAVGLTADTE